MSHPQKTIEDGIIDKQWMIPAAVGFSCCTDGGFPFCKHIKERRVNYEWNRDVENPHVQKESEYKCALRKFTCYALPLECKFTTFKLL
jgi:hypothetical protein